MSLENRSSCTLAITSFGYHGYNAAAVQMAMATPGTFYAMAPTSLLASSGNGFTVSTGAQLTVTGASSVTMRLEAFCNDGLVDFPTDYYQVTFRKNGTPVGPTTTLLANDWHISFAMSYQVSTVITDVWTVALTNYSSHNTDNFEGQLFLQAFTVP